MPYRILSLGFPDAESIDDSEVEEEEEEEEEEEAVNEEEEEVGYAQCSEDDNDSIRPTDDVREEEEEEVGEEEVRSHVKTIDTCAHTNHKLFAVVLITVTYSNDDEWRTVGFTSGPSSVPPGNNSPII